MPNPTIVSASLDDKELKQSIANLVAHVKRGLHTMLTDTNSTVDAMEKKLKSLGNLKIDSNGTADGGSSRRTSAVEKETKARKELNMTLDQQAAALEKASGKKKGIEYTTIPSDIDKSLTYLVNTNKDVDAQMSSIIQKEQALIDAKQREAQITEQIASAQRAANSVRGVSAYDLGINPNVSAGRQRQIESTRAASKETEYLKQQVASLLEVEEREIKTANTTSSSYAQLAQYLKNLQSAYQRLGADRIAKGEGTDLANEIQRTQRAMQKLQQTMSRPISLKDAMGLSEKTLDDIAYKMRQLASYRSGLNVDTQKKEIQQVNDEYNRLKKRMDEVMQKNQQMIALNTALGRSWNYMKNRLAFYFSVGASTAFVKNLIEVRSQYEMNERALGILIDSAERGTQIFNELSSMALVSPYTLIELSAAAKQLTAYDIAAKDVVDTTRRLADMASAVGIPIERLTYALGQIKAYGYLNSRDARMFANAGIPLVKQLSEYYTELEGRMVSTADVYDRMKKKAIDYSDVMSVINKMTDEGGKFFDFQAKMADTLKVRLANLTLAWNNMLNDIGESYQGWFSGSIELLKETFLHWQEINKVLRDVIIALGAVKGAQLLVNLAIGKGTQNAIAEIAAREASTAADYKNVISKNQLTAAQAKWLIASNKSNEALRAQIVNMKILTVEQANAAASGNGLKTLWYRMGTAAQGASKGIRSMAASLSTLSSTLVPMLVIGTIVDLFQTIYNRSNALKEVNAAIVNNADESAKAIKETLSSLDSIYKEANVSNATQLKAEEQKKAWELLREQIELSASAANYYIQTLLQINNMGVRVNIAKELLESIERIHGLMSMWHDDTINVTDDFKVLGIGADGLSEDLSDFQKYLNAAGGEVENLDELSKGLGGTWRSILAWVYDYSDILAKTGVGLTHPIGWLKNIGDATGLDFLRSDKAKLTDAYKEVLSEIEPLSESLQKQILRDGIKNANEIKEVVSKTISSIATERQWSEEKTLYARLLLEKEWGESSNAIFRNSVADRQTAWDAWLKFLTTRHKTEFSNMGNEEISAESWAQDKRKKLYEETFQKFKEYNVLAANQIENTVFNLNQLQVRIKVYYDEQNQPSWLEKDFKNRLPNSTLNVKEYKSVTDLISGEQKALKDANEEIKRLRNAGVSELDEHFLDVKNRARQATEALDAYNAEHEKETKGKSGDGSKKDPLLDALKQEISLVEKLQGDYDKLTKSGASQADALAVIRSAYGKTINLLNAKLGGAGLPTIEIDKLITGKDPNKALAHFKQTLDMLVSKGLLTFERSKELEAVVEKLTLSAKTYNLDKITKGLNNELGKLKDEYELAVELDANPELGGMFLDMFGIDPSDFSHNIDDYMFKVQSAFEKARRELGYGVTIDVFKANDEEWKKWGEWVGLSGETLDNFKARFVSAQGVAKKWAQDTIKATQDLEYKLGDLAKKVEIEEAKLAVLEDNAAKETNAAQKRLLELRIQEQKEAIEKLKMESVKLLPFYEDLFGDMYNVSVGRLKEIAKAAKEVMSPRQGDSGVGYTQRTDDKGNVVYDIFAKDKQGNIKKTTVSLEEYIKINKQIDSVQQKIAESSPWEKIKDSFSKKEGGGLKNFASGMEAIGGELQKVANITKEIGGFAEALGADENTVEIINDIAASIGGVATAAQGIGQIASGDYIGGAASVLSGAFSAISSWLDNSDKKIVAQIKDSEREVKKLENSYKNLEYAIEQAYGMAEYGARRAAIANQQLQLVELQRQLMLEQSRDSKHRDEDRIQDLKGQIIDLRNEISQSVDDITNDLLGISSIGDAAEQLVSSMIDAFRQGEDYMKQYDESFEKMIDNMIMKAIVSRVIGDRIEQMWNQVKSASEARGAEDRKRIEELTKQLSEAQDRATTAQSQYDETQEGWWGKIFEDTRKSELDSANAELERIKDELAKAEKDYAKAVEPTKEDVDSMREMAAGWRDDVKNEFEYWMGAFGIGFGEGSDKQLSSLQQGIQSVTETTAGAIEAYMNGVSQQVYLHSDLLTQIRDAVVGFDIDVQTASLSQILLQLQTNYIVMQSMHSMMENWTVPSGSGIRVELMS